MTRLVAELDGYELALWVARALNMPINPDVCQPDDAVFVGEGCGDLELFKPHTDWSHGGPLIEEYAIGFNPISDSEWVAEEYITGFTGLGPTPLIASMRALVASVYGDSVEEVAS